MITQPMVRRHFDPGSFVRGEQYHRQGRISALRSEAGQDGTVRVTAQVRGSLPSPYSQDIRLVLRNGAIASVSGECDCPVGFNCKHVAAALLAWAGSQQATAPASAPAREPEAPIAVRLLLSRLEEAAALDADDAYPERHAAVWSMRCGWMSSQAGTRPWCASCPFPCARTASSALRRNPNHPESVRASAVAQYITPADRAIWLIERMLRTGRLHWEDIRANPPLRPGSGRDGEAGWVADADGRQRFTIGIDGAAVRLLPTVPPVYVDLDRWECGTVATTVSPHVAAALLSAPPLAPADILAFRQGGRAARRAVLPVLPEPPAGAETCRIVPRPVLRLRLARAVSHHGYRPFSGVGCSSCPAMPSRFPPAGWPSATPRCRPCGRRGGPP